MLTDSFFEQGFTHEVCEDYALHGEDYAIVSDGCSNGGGPRIDSDWGARLICKAAEEQIKLMDPNVFLPVVGNRARMLMNSLPKLTPACLTATLMVLRRLPDKYHAMVVGDGIVGGKRKDGRWKIHVIEFPGGPFYLKYNIYQEEDLFIASFGTKFTVRTFFGKLMDPDLEPPETPDIRERMAQWAQVMTVTEKEYEIDFAAPYQTFEFLAEEYEFAFVCSDGGEAFIQPRVTTTHKGNENIYVLDALRVLLDFVTIRPAFAQLQRHWAFKQDKKGTFIRRNWKQSDDVSVGVIHG